jgi:hypothetical protein
MEGERCTLLTCPGGFGTYPWVDRAAGLHGLVFLRDRLRRIGNAERAMIDAEPINQYPG